MSRSKHVQAAIVTACVATVAALGAPASGTATVGDDVRRAAGTSADARVIVPRGPGEDARTFTQWSPRVREIARRSARSEQANAADRRFVRHMIPHHYQAILMSRLAPERFKDKRIRAMAKRIRTEQDLEIDSMQGWQGSQGLPVTKARESYRHMLHHNPEMLEEMGMATAKQMSGLRAADGRGFDRRFVRLMIPHHKGAIRMAEEVAGSGNDVYIRQLATDLISSQSRQIHDLRQIRKSW